jgi:acyl dehydratase
MTDKHLSWDDVQEGQEIPPYTVKVGYMELNRFAGANDEYVPIHMDAEYAKNVAKLPDVIVMGNLKLAYLANALSDWIGDDGWIEKLAVDYRKMDVVNKSLSAKGKVTKKYQENGKSLVDLEVWIENEDGEVTTPGRATVSVPARG